MTGAVLYTQGFGSRPENVEVPTYSNRAPNPADNDYPIGKRWINSSLNEEYVLTSKKSFDGSTTSNWILLQPNAFFISYLGTAAFVSGNVVIHNAAVLPSSYIIITRTNNPGNASVIEVTNITTGQFNVSSFNGADSSTFSYIIVN
jgi:hypothetical protein